MMNNRTWDHTAPGAVVLPSGRVVLGRALSKPRPLQRDPELGIYLSFRPPRDTPWDSRWIQWADFWIPSSRPDAYASLTEAWKLSAAERVEVACRGGIGRTGTALAVLAVLDGIEPRAAIKYIRENYHPRAVETPWQRRWVTRLPEGAGGASC